jgi:hypothetical protein
MGREERETVFFASVAAEHKERENFASFFIADKSFKKQKFDITETKIPYLPSLTAMGGKDMSKLDTKIGTGRFGKPISRDDDQKKFLAILAEKPDKTVVESLICQLVTPRFQNFVFVMSGESHIQHIITAMLENNISIDPGCIIKDGRVLLLEVKQFGISFISASRFLDGSILDLKKQFGLNGQMPFFPQALCHPKWTTSDLTEPPPLEFYFDISDSAAIIGEKQKYHQSICKKPWNFEEALESVCRAELNILLHACVSLLRISFGFQEECEALFLRPKILKRQHVPFLHLFHYCSLGSFTHNVFRFYSLGQDNPLFAIMPAKKTNVSVGELEYTGWLTHLFPNQYITVFSSSEGQKKIEKEGFDTIIPDAFGKGARRGHLHFYNGCWCVTLISLKKLQ